MSLRWKSELRVRLGREASTVQVLAPWSRRVRAECSAAGTAGAALAVALQRLREQGLNPLPTQARLLVPDEHAYLSLRPLQATWALTRQDAAEHFARALGRQDLRVQVAVLPGHRTVLAAAIEPSDLDAWSQPLVAAGVAVVHVELALIDDLNSIAAAVGNQAIVALLREEGMTVLRIAGGIPVDISWERCDPHASTCMEQRLMACQLTGDATKPDRLVLLCRSQAQRSAWQLRAQGHRWKLLLRHSGPMAAQAGMTT